MMEDVFSHWGSDPPTVDVDMLAIDHFDARGMRRVYGRGDQLGDLGSFNMDIWKTHDRRLLMRCWSRCEDIDWRSFEIKGVDVVDIPRGDRMTGFQDSWVPVAARMAYDQWIQEEL